MRAVLRALLVLVCLFAREQATIAAPADRVSVSHSTVSLAVDRDGVRPGHDLWAALTITPREGWHSYWKNPGDSGSATWLAWTGAQAEEPLYPAPERLPVGPLMNYGYDGPATLLIHLDLPEDVTDRHDITLEAEWLICDVECVPQTGRFSLSLPVDPAASGPDGTATVFAEARATMPRPSPFAAGLKVDQEQSVLSLPMGAAVSGDVTNAYFFPEQEGIATYASEQELVRDGDELRLAMPRLPFPIDADSFSGVLRLTWSTGAQTAWAVDGPLSKPRPAPAVAGGRIAPGGLAVSPSGGQAITGLLQAIFFAFIGGVILNAMPCVFPILFIKAAGLIRAGSEGRAAADGLLYTAGVMTTFWVIAGIMAALRAGGTSVGWGFQLQSPPVVAGLALVLFIVALSFLGAVNVGGRLTGLGDTLTRGHGAASSYFTGVLAVVVASPCTAPLMATAIGFAAVQPVAIGLAIFTALGLGLALPYLLIAVAPPLRRLLPRPGAWMDRVKQAMAFPILLTVVWLVWVLGNQAGANAVALVLGLMVVVAFSVWIVASFPGRAGQIAAAVLVMTGIGATAGLGTQFSGTSTTAAAGEEAPGRWSSAAIEESLAEGRPVFVNFTADWCITCLVNERVVFSDPAVADFMASQQITLLKADWTLKDDRIAAELARFGRNGVPLYLFYPKAGVEPVVLPQVLTPGGFMDRLSQALAPIS